MSALGRLIYKLRVKWALAIFMSTALPPALRHNLVTVIVTRGIRDGWQPQTATGLEVIKFYLRLRGMEDAYSNECARVGFAFIDKWGAQDPAEYLRILELAHRENDAQDALSAAGLV